jgi:hypothetical protein
MATVKVLTPVKRNGERYKAGDTFSVSGDELEELLASGAVAKSDDVKENDEGQLVVEKDGVETKVNTEAGTVGGATMDTAPPEVKEAPEKTAKLPGGQPTQVKESGNITSGKKAPGQ